MYDAAAAVHVIETEQDLFGDLLAEMHGYAFVLMALDETEQVLSEDLEDHADVGAVGPLVSEVVEEGNDMGSAGMCEGGGRGSVWVVGGRGGGGDESLEEFDLVEGGLCVSGCRFDDFEGNVAVQSEWKVRSREMNGESCSLCVLCQPDGRKVTPSEFPDDLVAFVGEYVANVYGMVPALDIVLPILFVLRHGRVRVRRVVGSRA